MYNISLLLGYLHILYSSACQEDVAKCTLCPIYLVALYIDLRKVYAHTADNSWIKNIQRWPAQGYLLLINSDLLCDKVRFY